MPIILKSPILEMKKIKKSTKAKVFKDLEVGSKIRLTIPVQRAGSNRGTYASYIRVENLETREYTEKSFNQLPRFLNYFELEPIRINQDE